MAGTNRAIGGGGFHHVAVRVGDLDRAVRFYVGALGMVEFKAWGEGDGRGVMLDTGDGSCLELFAGGTDGPKEGGAILHVALRSTDVDAAIARARAGGAEVTVEPKNVDIPTQPGPYPVRIAFCRAPDGTVVEFFQERAG
jgi:glyoxylase I family protein